MAESSDGRRSRSPATTLTRQEKRSIALLTVGFIVMSGLVHAVVGGTGARFWPHQMPIPEPSATLLRWGRLETPKPTPTPPPIRTPRPLLSPQPTSSERPVSRPVVSHPPIIPGTPELGSSPKPISDKTPHPANPTPGPTPTSTAATTSGEYESAHFRHKVEPVYPPIAIEQHTEGIVVVLVTIGPEGQILDLRLDQSSGFKALDDAALAAAAASTYYPPEINGRPGTETYRVIYTFNLQ